MKIALFSDIHANLPAFEAFLADLDSHKPDAVYCLGDMIGYNVWPNEVITGIRKRGIPALAGNHDLKDDGYAYELVSVDNRAYLNTLPAHIKLEYRLNNEHFNIVLAHGSTRSINEYILESLDESYILEMMNETQANMLCVGHSHLPYYRAIGSKHVINTGSVGKPKDGDPRGCYVLLTVDDQIQVDFIRFEYDITKSTNAIEASPLPNEFADRLKKAY
jgi:putative phosphoesterase